MLLNFLTVILVQPRFPENIGMVARACANMGCPHIILVRPELWLRAKAEPLATAKGLPMLDNLVIADSLGDALAPFAWSIATTARLGGWRRSILHPEQAAAQLMQFSGQSAALVMGPEDRGLNNEEISQCSAIASIPTSGASSLNLAQAALIMLYELQKMARKNSPKTAGCGNEQSCGNNQSCGNIQQESQNSQVQGTAKFISQEQTSRLEHIFKDALLKLDCIPGQNSDYFFGKWRQILRRAPMRQHEYDCWMGFCRQILNKTNPDASD